MNLGAEPKKLAILAALLVVALLMFVFNGGSGSSSKPGPAATPPKPVPAASTNTPPGVSGTSASSGTGPALGGGRSRPMPEFPPHIGAKRGQPRPDPMSIDPTLRLDVLARLQTVEVTGAHRSLFDFGQAPPPKPDPVKVAAAAKAKVPSPIVPIQPAEPAPAPDGPPPKPQAPPVPLKFYGYVNPSNQAQKRAFFVEGEEIHIVREGELVNRRYKIVRIGVNSVVVEDTQFPGSQQTLPLEEQPG